MIGDRMGTPSSAAPAGTMSPGQLRLLEHFLTKHFGNSARLDTVETGCGQATVLFSKHAGHHSAYCADDRGRPLSAVDAVTGDKAFDPRNVAFKFGEPYQTLLSETGLPPVDIAVIGGARNYPFPDLEFLGISRRLRYGSILILRDVDIPTIHNLFRVLSADDHFYLSQLDYNMAVFWCAVAPGEAFLRQPWWTQRFNAENYPAFERLAYRIGLPVPFRAGFDGWLTSLPDYFRHGATLLDGRPLLGGINAAMNIVLETPSVGPLVIELDGDIVGHEQQQPISVSCGVNGIACGTHVLASSGRQKLTFPVDLKGGRVIEMFLTFSGVAGLDRMGWPTAALKADQGVMLLRSLAILPASATAAHPQGTEVQRMDGSLVGFDFRGTPLKFFVHDPHDSIQAHHAVGQLYEVEELDLLLSHLKPGMRVLDVGANIGNHTVWFEKIAGAGRIVALEPQPRIAKLLTLNCQLNQLSRVDLSKVGFALGNASTRGSIRIPQAFNPAGAVIEKDPAGQVPIVPGDELLQGEAFDFIKIDVEGGELDVIEGLRGLIGRCRPMMFVEVWEANRAGFDALMRSLDYEVASEYRRYDVANNLLVRPTDARARS